MKQAFQKIVAMTMAILVLLSTVSFTAAKHYCGNMLVDIALYKEAKTCGMEITNSTSSCELMITKSSCCKDEQLVHQGQDELKTSWEHPDMEQQLFIVYFCYSYATLFDDRKENKTIFDQYRPPLLVRDIPILNASFLI